MGVQLQLIALAVVIILIAFFLMYNKVVLKFQAKSNNFISQKFYKLFGHRVKFLETKLNRTVSLNRRSFVYTIYNFFYDILVNLDLVRVGVTVTGLLFFIGILSACAAFILVVLLNGIALYPFAFAAVAYLITIIFKFISLSYYEQREAHIMDAVDLLVSDIKGGVANAVSRYKNSFHPTIRPYFLNFLDNKNKGYGFSRAMIILNQNLGAFFDDFAQKAILYESKADSSMDDIFSSLLETNRQIRTLRYTNGLKFKALRTQFLASVGIIGGYIVFVVFKDPFLRHFITQTFIGKILIIADIVLIAVVLGYLSSIKAKTL